jgi:polyisoprenoid-binding protein YceI
MIDHLTSRTPMKKALVFLFAAIWKFTSAQYKPVDSSSVVEFKVRNFGFNVSGTLTGLSGRIKFDPGQPDEATFDVSIDVGSINTGNDMRDDHLRKFAYLDARGHPRIRIVSDRITASHHKGVFTFTGKLTIKDHTAPVSFPFTAEPAQGGYHFNGMFTIDRRDFDVGGFSTISDDVQVSLSVLAK